MLVKEGANINAQSQVRTRPPSNAKGSNSPWDWLLG